MDSQMINTVAAAFRMVDFGGLDEGELAEALVETLAAAGFALMKLPEIVVDQDERQTWTVDAGSRPGVVFRRNSDDALVLDGVATIFWEPSDALSLAAALIAAAQHVMQAKRDA